MCSNVSVQKFMNFTMLCLVKGLSLLSVKGISCKMNVKSPYILKYIG